jgi:hypothetical protein
MATTPSNPTRLRTPSPASFTGQGLRVTTTVVPLRPIPSRQPSIRVAHQLALQKEPEDACLTGGTRSLDRRLLALNLYRSPIKAKATPLRSTPLPCSTAA